MHATATPAKTQRSAYNEAQLGRALGWTARQIADARAGRLVPDPDVHRPRRLGPRWSPTLVRDLLQRRDALTADLEMGTLGAIRVAELMSDRLGTNVNPDAVRELALWGYLPRAGTYKGHDLYAAWVAARFTDRAALAEATVTGQLLTADDAAKMLKVRRSDVDNLTRQAWLWPTHMADNPMLSRSRGAGTVPLYRSGHLAALREHPDINWNAVRATPPGRRSPLARLERCDTARRAEIEQLCRGVFLHQLGHRRWAAGDRDAALEDWQAAAGHPAAAEHVHQAGACDDVVITRCAVLMTLTANLRVV